MLTPTTLLFTHLCPKPLKINSLNTGTVYITVKKRDNAPTFMALVSQWRGKMNK